MKTETTKPTGPQTPTRDDSMMDEAEYEDQPTPHFADLQAAHRSQIHRHAQNRKYNFFRYPGPSRGDLHSSPNQQAHYLPTCRNPDCPHNRCWWLMFPADLSTAPIAKFTRRQAWTEAQRWPRLLTFKKSAKRMERNCENWTSRQLNKRVVTRELERVENLCDIKDTVYEDWVVDVLHDAERHRIFESAEQSCESIEDYPARRDSVVEQALSDTGQALNDMEDEWDMLSATSEDWTDVGE